jgi:hypothetical protein
MGNMKTARRQLTRQSVLIRFMGIPPFFCFSTTPDPDFVPGLTRNPSERNSDNFSQNNIGARSFQEIWIFDSPEAGDHGTGEETSA